MVTFATQRIPVCRRPKHKEGITPMNIFFATKVKNLTLSLNIGIPRFKISVPGKVRVKFPVVLTSRTVKNKRT